MNEEKLAKFEEHKAAKGNPFVTTTYAKVGTIAQLREAFAEGKQVATAGRLMNKRGHGKCCFFDIADSTGKIQGCAKADTVGDDYAIFKRLDIGDIIGMEGEFFTTHQGEPTVLVKSFKLLSKSFRDLPEKFHGLKDVEVRFRKRYIDLIANHEAAETFAKRSRIVKGVRKFWDDLGFMEVETPMLHAIPGGAAGRPFETHHNALDLDIFLRIAPELYLKRLLVGGYDRVYEINRSFRNEGLSVRHNPEFTMIEIYCAYHDYTFMMQQTESLFRTLAMDVLGTTTVQFGEKTIDFSKPFRVLSLADTLKEEYGIEYTDTQDQFVEKMRKRMNLGENMPRNQLLKMVEDIIEEKFYGTEPVFVTDYYTWMSPLAKAKPGCPTVAERFELFICGMEVANAYSELNDPIEQKGRFVKQLETEEELPKKVDDDFLEALEFGMPPATGLGIGIDRLVMILLNKTTIREVILFPLMRPECEDESVVEQVAEEA
jgi:lysyl-tRNA synthetase class 2